MSFKGFNIFANKEAPPVLTHCCYCQVICPTDARCGFVWEQSCKLEMALVSESEDVGWILGQTHLYLIFLDGKKNSFTCIFSHCTMRTRMQTSVVVVKITREFHSSTEDSLQGSSMKYWLCRWDHRTAASEWYRLSCDPLKLVCESPTLQYSKLWLQWRTRPTKYWNN